MRFNLKHCKTRSTWYPCQKSWNKISNNYRMPLQWRLCYRRNWTILLTKLFKRVTQETILHHLTHKIKTYSDKTLLRNLLATRQPLQTVSSQIKPHLKNKRIILRISRNSLKIYLGILMQMCRTPNNSMKSPKLSIISSQLSDIHQIPKQGLLLQIEPTFWVKSIHKTKLHKDNKS
jgi:hypothetical protein